MYVIDILYDYQMRNPQNDRTIVCQLCKPLYRNARKLLSILPRNIEIPVTRKCRYCLLRLSVLDDVKTRHGEFRQLCLDCVNIFAEAKLLDRSKVYARSKIFPNE